MRNYKNLECLIINEREIRHEFRDRSNDLKVLIKKLSKEQKIKNLIVTSGKKGATLYNLENNKFVYSEALARKVVDKIGAGDSMLALIALCLKSKVDNLMSLFIGSWLLLILQKLWPIKNTWGNKMKILKGLEHLLK